MTDRLARVIAVHPARRTVDVVFLDTGNRVAEVQVMSGSVGSDSGSWDMPSVKPFPSEAGPDQLDQAGRNVIARCSTIHGRWVVAGFMSPQNSQMNFTEQNRAVHRHASGAYTTTAPDGSVETYHPSGAYVRIGTGAHQDLNDVSADKNWSIPPGSPPAQITVHTAGFTLTILPNGSTTLETTGQLVMKYHDAELHGDIKLFGKLEATGDVVAGTVSLQHHTHSNSGGSGSGGPPNV